MGLQSDLKVSVEKIFKDPWTERDGTVVPTDASVKLGNDAVKLKATILYADMADSTKLVDTYKKPFAAEIYKTFLHCAGKIIESEGGTITAYDGDRVMAVFIGDPKNTPAVRAALKIHWAVLHVIIPAKKAQYPANTYTPRHVVGIDTSEVFVAKTGVRGANDLVWVGRAANHAAKLSSLPHDYATYISKEVFDGMLPAVKTTNGSDMWEKIAWNELDGRDIYRSSWWWRVPD